MSGPRKHTPIRLGRFLTATLVTFACALLLSVAARAATTTKGVVAVLGGSRVGTLGGQFSKPADLAVDQTTGDVYIADAANDRVQELSETGEFLRAWGYGVAVSGPDDVNTSEVKSLKIAAGGGTYTLNVGGTVLGTLVIGGQTTGPIAYDASASAVQAALEALPAFASEGGTVSVTGGPGDATGSNPYNIALGGTLAGVETPLTPSTSGWSMAVGQTLTCTLGPSTATTKEYQWLRDGTPIGGATSSTYTTVDADAGKAIQCQVFAINASTGATQVSSPGDVVVPAPAVAVPVPPASIAAPSRSAALTVGGAGGQTLTCAPGTWTGATGFGYQWYRNGVALSGNGATSEKYTVQAADLATAAAFQCAVTGSNEGGAVTLVSANLSTSPAPSPAAPTATSSAPSQASASVTVLTAATAAFEVCSAASGDTCKAGLPKASAGGMSEPQGVAVEPANGNVFVTDEKNERIDVFSATGSFEGAFGWGVATGGSALEFCTTTCEAGRSGSGAGEFGSTIGNPAYDPSSGNLYVADSANRRVDEFSFTLTAGEVTGAAFVRGYGWGASTGAAEFQVCTTTCHAANTASGTGPGQFGSESPTRIAVDNQGGVYAVDAKNSRVQKFSAGAELDGVFASAQLSGTPAVSNIAVNPLTDHVVAVRACTAALCPEALISSENRIYEFDTGGTLLATYGAGEGLGTGTEVKVTGLAAGGSAGNIYMSTAGFQPSELQQLLIVNTPVVPVVAAEAASGIHAHEATLHGTVNPSETAWNQLQTEYQFEISVNGSTWVKVGAPGKIAASGMPVAVSQTIAGLEAHTVYHVRLHAEKEYASGSATTTTAEEFTTASAPPAVSGQSVSNVEATGALIAAAIDPEGAETAYRVEYGTSTAYGSSLPTSQVETELGAGVAAVAVSVQPEGLLPGTLYYYRVIAENTNGTGEATGTFTTSEATLPGVLTNSASAVAQNTATIAGVVDTHGQATSYGFEIGTSPGEYGPPTGLGYVGAGLNETEVSLALTGLAPGMTYYYRVSASDVNGTSYGAMQSFTTPVFSSLQVTPPAPLPFVTVPAIKFPTQTTGSTAKKSAKTKKKQKTLTRSQKLKRALKACAKEAKTHGSKHARAKCEGKARKRFGRRSK